MKFVRSFSLWCVALVVVAGFAFALAPSGASSTNRIAHLETLVRCPSCVDLSVAVSDATSAIAVRREIAAKVHQGQSDNEILTSLEAVYGTSILLSPPASGLGVVLWLGPIVVIALLIASAIRLARRR
ncbi:MAG: cytochrome c-type biogenesis protein [Acidimicrobiales bacterium]